MRKVCAAIQLSRVVYLYQSTGRDNTAPVMRMKEITQTRVQQRLPASACDALAPSHANGVSTARSNSETAGRPIDVNYCALDARFEGLRRGGCPSRSMPR